MLLSCWRCCCCCLRIHTMHTNERVCLCVFLFTSHVCKHCSCSRYSANVFCKEQNKTIINTTRGELKHNERISMEKRRPIALNNFHWIRAHTNPKLTELAFWHWISSMHRCTIVSHSLWLSLDWNERNVVKLYFALMHMSVRATIFAHKWGETAARLSMSECNIHATQKNEKSSNISNFIATQLVKIMAKYMHALATLNEMNTNSAAFLRTPKKTVYVSYFTRN